MIWGKTEGRWVLTSQPSGVPSGAGETGQVPAAVDTVGPVVGDGRPPPPGPGVLQAAVSSASAHAETIAKRRDRVMPEA